MNQHEVVELTALQAQSSTDEDGADGFQHTIESSLCDSEESRLLVVEQDMACDDDRTQVGEVRICNPNNAAGAEESEDARKGISLNSEEDMDGGMIGGEGTKRNEEVTENGRQVSVKKKCITYFITSVKKLFLDLKLFLWYVVSFFSSVI